MTDSSNANGNSTTEAFASSYLNDVLQNNQSLPLKISSITILGAKHTKSTFLERVLERSLFSAIKRDDTRPLQEILLSLNQLGSTLDKFQIFNSVGFTMDNPRSMLASKDSVDVYLHLKERSRLTARTGADFGTDGSEASGNIKIDVLNAFGGAETVSLQNSVGNHTKSSFDLSFQRPVDANPDVKFEVSATKFSRDNSFYADHTENYQGLSAKIKRVSDLLGYQELSMNLAWRQITDIPASASQHIREQAGDSLKSSFVHFFQRDRRDDPLLPTNGYMIKSTQEIAGYGLGGEINFAKAEGEVNFAQTIINKIGLVGTLGLRGGLLLPLSFKDEPAIPSRIPDRFQLGGPSNVRGFYTNGLGPRDKHSSLGGDVYVAYGGSLRTPVPGIPSSWPLRLQGFVNGGSLLPSSAGNYKDIVKTLVAEPSVSGGVGLIFRHSIARFELNFCLPIASRASDRMRKGFQFGIGLEFL